MDADKEIEKLLEDDDYFLEIEDNLLKKKKIKIISPLTEKRYIP